MFPCGMRDYLRFFEVCDKYSPQRPSGQHYDRRKDCITPLRGYLQNTSILLEDVLGDTIMAFIDIFFYTGVPENPYARRLDQMNLLWKSLRVTKTPLSEDKGNSIARTAKKAFNRLIIDHNNPRRTQRVMSSMKKKLTKGAPMQRIQPDQPRLQLPQRLRSHGGPYIGCLSPQRSNL